MTLCWGLVTSLWLPYLDAGKSYRTMIESIVRQLPVDGCVASHNLAKGNDLRLFREPDDGAARTGARDAMPDAAGAGMAQYWCAGAVSRLGSRLEGARPGTAQSSIASSADAHRITPSNFPE